LDALNQLLGTWATPHMIALLGRGIGRNILTVTLWSGRRPSGTNPAIPHSEYKMTLTRPAGWGHLSWERRIKINNAPAIVVKHRDGNHFEPFGPG
jgi:hypothetical protein